VRAGARRRTWRPVDEQHPLDPGPLGDQGVAPIRQTAQRALDRRPGQVRRRRGRQPQPVHRTDGVRRVGRAPLQTGRDDQAVGTSGRDSARLGSASWSTPSSRAATSRTRAALSVRASGRKFPVASPKPATEPLGSAAGAQGLPRRRRTCQRRPPRPRYGASDLLRHLRCRRNAHPAAPVAHRAEESTGRARSAGAARCRAHGAAGPFGSCRWPATSGPYR